MSSIHWSLRFLPPFKKKRMKIHVRSSNCPMMNSSSSLVTWVRSSYGFVACVSDRFNHVYLDTFGVTSIKSAAVSPSRAELCLDTEGSYYNTRTGPLFQAATSNGKLDVLKWGQDSGYELDNMLDENGIANAVLNRHLEVVKYLRKLGISWNERTCSNAAMNGHLDLLKWCRANQCPWNVRTCSNAAFSGHLELLKWARANQCSWDGCTCTQAALNGHLELLKWARVNLCPWSVWTCAAKNGHLELLKWARVNQCPWGEYTCAHAAMNDHFELLKWCRANQCPWNEGTCAYMLLVVVTLKC